MMHRRPVCRLSRRAEWSNSAYRTPTLTALTLRRTLQFSATRWNSSDPSSGNDDGTALNPAPVKPKFGSRWGPKQTTPSAGLSFAEQAMRQTLVANSQPPPPPAPAPPQRRREQSNQQWNSGQSNQQRKPSVRRVGPRDNQDAYMMGSRETPRNPGRNSSTQEKNPFKEESSGSYMRWPKGTSRNQERTSSTQEQNPFKEENAGSFMRWPKGTTRNQERTPYTQEQNPFKEENAGSYMRWPKGTSRNQQRNPSIRGTKPAFEEENPFAPEKTQNRFQGQFESRATRDHPMARDDWNCPQCMKHVFATKQVCPFCKTSRPGDAQPKFRITREYSDSPGPSQFRQSRSPSEHTRKFQQLGDSVLSELEQDVQPNTTETTARHSKESDRPQTKEEAEDFKKNQWSWDMSALEQLEELDAQEQPPPKPMKRRDGRKGRQSESDEADFDSEDRERLRIERRLQQKEKEAQRAAKKAATLAAPAPLYLPEFISVSNLADVVGVRPAQFVERMEEMGFEEITYRDILDAETAGLVAAEFNYEAIFDSGKADLYAAPELEDTSDLPSRPPVVTIMGHVDHGKTTILDWLRKSSVAASEHGGITQHIGAFSVMMPSGKAITFLDTPGHSAFLEMRRRGADVTDIVVLVVAADDSVKPQTIEAIKHATQANVPVIVAISKIDKEGNNPDRVKGDLSIHGIHVEDYGGDVQAIGVSGKTGQGMVELEEAIVALSEMLDHRAATTCNVEGWVIEASTKSYGRVASVLIRRGTLRPGDIIVAGTAWARVRTLRNEAGLTISEATPGMPVEIDGWREQPGAGTELLQAPTEQKAKDVVDYRLEKSDTQKMGIDIVAINEARREVLEKRRREKEEEETTTTEVEPTGPKSVNFVLKGDVDGSVEAVLNSVAAVGTNEVFANIIRSGVGPVGEFDIEHAGSAKGKIISFNQAIDPNIMRIAETEGVEILDHNIIYKLIDDIKAILSEKLPPSVTMRVTGEAEIQQVFEITVKGREKTAIAGSRVRNGLINKTRKVRVLRGEEIVYDGTMVSLKNVKKDVTEMRKDTECGIAFENWTDFAPGDHVQCYEEISEKRYL